MTSLATIFGEPVAETRLATTISGELALTVLGIGARPIAGALLALADADTVVSSDQSGRIRLQGLRIGKHSVRLRALGYLPRQLQFAIGPDRRGYDTTVILTPAPQVLDSIVVAGKGPDFLAGKMVDVERRRRDGFGRFLNRIELHDPLSGGLDGKLRRFAKMRVEPRCFGEGYAAAGALRTPPPVRVLCRDGTTLLPCFMAVYLDGALYWSPDMGRMAQPPDITKFNPLDLEAVEVYRSPAEVPVEYNGPASGCGVLLIWTRVG